MKCTICKTNKATDFLEPDKGFGICDNCKAAFNKNPTGATMAGILVMMKRVEDKMDVILQRIISSG